jgi:hypothetical protein
LAGQSYVVEYKMSLGQVCKAFLRVWPTGFGFCGIFPGLLHLFLREVNFWNSAIPAEKVCA